MKRLSLLLMAGLMFPGSVLADVITLKDGTKLEGEIRRAGDVYTVKSAGGIVSNVAVERVASIEVKPQAGADAVMSRFQSLRRAADNVADIRQIIERYRSFIEQNPNTPAADAAQKEMQLWVDRLDHGLVKVGDKWVTPQERDVLRSKSSDIAIALHDMLKQGRIKESTPLIEHSLQIDPQNIALQYLHGVVQYQQELLPPARKSWEAVIATAPDHAPTLNNLAVVLWRQHALAAALTYYDRALLAAPANKVILDNIAEALNALPKEQRETPVTKKVVRHFKEQDDVLQKKMLELGLYRWGASWVNEKELKKLKEDEKVIKDQIATMQTDFEAVQKRITALDRQISEIVNEMNLIDAQTYQTGANGQPFRTPYPPIYFTLNQQLGGLRAERSSRVNDLENLRKGAKQAVANLPAPKYSGIQKIVDADGVPLPAGILLPAPLPPPAPAAPAAAPPPTTVPATQPATVTKAPL